MLCEQRTWGETRLPKMSFDDYDTITCSCFLQMCCLSDPFNDDYEHEDSSHSKEENSIELVTNVNRESEIRDAE